MHYHKTYLYINYQQNRASRLVKPVHTNLYAINCKLLKFATLKKMFGAMHFIYDINRLITTKVDSTYLGY